MNCLRHGAVNSCMAHEARPDHWSIGQTAHTGQRPTEEAEGSHSSSKGGVENLKQSCSAFGHSIKQLAEGIVQSESTQQRHA